MKKTATVTAFVIALVLNAEAKAGGPPPVCMVVDKVVLEPDGNTPTRIQIWGTFIFCKNNATYDRPVTGYLYYTAEAGKEDACRKEWANLQKLAARQAHRCPGFCGRPKVDGHLREANKKPESPVVFTVGENQGFTNGDAYERDFPSAKKLLAKVSPKKRD